MFTSKSIAPLFRLSNLSRLGFASVTALALLGCQTPPLPEPLPPPVVVPSYSGPTLPIEQSERGVQIFLPSAALFAIGKADLNPTESAAYLNRVAQLLNNKTVNNIQLEGHTDNIGSSTSNQTLSEARARTVRDALVKLGVTPARLSTVGYAFNRPVASNSTEEGRKFNRRVEILILDEKIENITKGEAPNAFESAWAKLKSMIEQGLIKPIEGK